MVKFGLVFESALVTFAVALGAGCGDTRGSAPEPSVEPDASVQDADVSSGCSGVDSTYAAIQRSIFEAHGCTSKSCHGGEDTQADLNLTAGVSYRNLVAVEARGEAASTKLMRVLPGGGRAGSLLYLKLAAATHGEPLPSGAGAPMPAGGAPAVPAEKLDALALWILAGSPEEGVVKGTERLLGCELPEATPPPYKPLAPPEEGQGYQLHAPGWVLAAGAESEVCFATYYDLSERAAPEALIACPVELGSKETRCVAHGDALMTQTAQSHHSNVYAYLGEVDVNDAAWGAWSCLGGELAGMSCDPKRPAVSAREGGGDCGAQSGCTSLPRPAPGCVGWGPADFATKRRLIGGAQTIRASTPMPEGVYGVIPVRGLVVWNSHGFNLTRKDGTIEMTLNMQYASPEQRRYLFRTLFDDGDLLAPNVAPFAQREFCRTVTFPRGTRLQYLVGHMHKRGTLFRIWDPPHSPCRALDANCVAPSDGEPIYASRHYDDQTQLIYDQPRPFEQVDDKDRTLLYCVLYDNGKSDPSKVKRRSTSPLPGGVAPGGPCAEADAFCLGGDHQGEACHGDHSVCSGGGTCDACPVKGGATTEDEMLLLMGGYHVVETSN
jgi:hypothetical protein